MANPLSLVWDLIAIDHASGTFTRVGGAAESTAGSVKKVLEGFGLLAAGGAIVSATKQAAEFQSQMLLLRTQAFDTTDNLGKMSDAVLGLSGKVAQAPEELATSLYHLTSIGLRGKQALDAMTIAAEGADVGHANLEATTNSLTSTIASGILGTDTYAQAMGKLNAIVGAGDMKMEDLNAALSNGLLPTMHLYGVTLTQTGAALATFGDVNIRGEDAATALRMAVQSFFKLTQQGPAILDKYHLSQQQLIDDLHQGGLTQALDDLHKHLVAGGVATNEWGQIITQVFGKRAGVGLSVLLDELDRYHGKLIQVDQGASQFGDAWAKTQDTAKFKVGQLKDSVDALGVKIGTGLLPALGTVSGWLASTGIPDVEKFGTTVGKAFTSIEHSQAWQSVLATGRSVIQGLITDGQNLVHGLESSGGLRVALDDAAAAGGVALTVLEKLAGLASGTLGTAVHLFGELPGPVQGTVAALAALKVVSLTGVFDPLLAKGGQALTMVKNLGGGTVSTVNQMRTAFGVAKASQEAVLGAGGLGGTLISRATGNLAGLGAAADTLASKSFGALRSAGSSVVNFLGGPWVVGIAAATTAIVGSEQQLKEWATALEQGGQAAWDATQQLEAAHTRSIASAHSLGDAWGIVKGAFSDGLAQIEGYSSAQDKATQSAKDWYNALSPSQKLTQDVTVDQNNLNDAVDTYGRGSSEARYQAWRLNLALGDQQTHQHDVDLATRGTNGALSAQIGLQQQLSQSGLNLDQAQLSAKQSIDQYKSSLKDVNLTEDDRKQLLYGVEQNMYGVLDAAKLKADAETKGLPQQLITNQEIVRQRDALQQVVDKLGFVPPALQSMYDSLNGPTAKALQATQTNVDNVGSAMTTVTTNDVPGMLKALGDLAKAAGTTFPQAVTGGFLPAAKGAGDMAVITAGQVGQTKGGVDDLVRSLIGVPTGTDTSNKALSGTGWWSDLVFGKIGSLSDAIRKIPGVQISADATQANNTIDAFLQKVQQQGFVGAIWNINPIGGGNSGGVPGLPPVPHRAFGGAISGPGTGTSDSVLIAASNGEHMWTAAEVAAAGGHGAVESLRKAVLGAGGGRAGGGPVLPHSLMYPLDAGPGLMALVQREAHNTLAAMSAPGAGGSVERWRGLVDMVLGMLGISRSADNGVLNIIAHESGGNPNAINLTDSNARAGHPSQGLMQTIPGTFYAWAGPYAGRGITDPLANIYAGVNYALHNYGAGMLTAGGRKNAFGGYMGYDDGGWLEPGLTMAYNGTGKPERIRTAEQEKALSAGQTIVGSQYLAPVTITDTDARDARSYRHAAMAAARYRG